MKEVETDNDDNLDDDNEQLTPLQYANEVAGSAVDLNTRFLTLMKKGVKIQCNNMVKFSNQTYIFAKQFSVGLPEKLRRSSSKIINSMNKTCVRIYKGMTMIWDRGTSSSGGH